MCSRLPRCSLIVESAIIEQLKVEKPPTMVAAHAITQKQPRVRRIIATCSRKEQRVR
jgi:hypothetical protein